MFCTFELRRESTSQIGHFLVTFVCNQKMTKNMQLLRNCVSWVPARFINILYLKETVLLEMAQNNYKNIYISSLPFSQSN